MKHQESQVPWKMLEDLQKLTVKQEREILLHGSDTRRVGVEVEREAHLRISFPPSLLPGVYIYCIYALRTCQRVERRLPDDSGYATNMLTQPQAELQHCLLISKKICCLHRNKCLVCATCLPGCVPAEALAGTSCESVTYPEALEWRAASTATQTVRINIQSTSA